jgi:hypothetical protein
MSNYLRVVLFAICLTMVPTVLFAQTDICSTLPYANSGSGTPGEVIVVDETAGSIQARQEQERAGGRTDVP